MSESKKEKKTIGRNVFEFVFSLISFVIMSLVVFGGFYFMTFMGLSERNAILYSIAIFASISFVESIKTDVRLDNLEDPKNKK